jgi:TatD DNase family protein
VSASGLRNTQVPGLMETHPPGLVDTHAHLMDAAFDPDRPAVLNRATAAGVAALVLVGYDLPSSRAAVDLAAALPWVRASVGIHPNSAAQATDADFEEIARLARAAQVVAIGETGLDYYRQYTPHSRQREALAWHMRLADELELPIIVHNRQADVDLAGLLGGSTRAGDKTDERSRAPGGATGATRTTATVAGVLHCFSSTDPAFLEHMLGVGFMVSFAGTLTYKNAGDLRAMAPRVPLDRILVETDCPYLAPAPHRGRRNEPAFVRDTAVCLADTLELPLEALVGRLWANSVRVFPAFERTPLEVG